jgi:superfamily II DNA or RNA helicase
MTESNFSTLSLAGRALEIPLREPQKELIESAKESLRKGHKRIILQAVTGFGKTWVAAAIISAAVEKGRSVLFLAPRRELVYQASETLEKFGIHNDIVMAGEDTDWYWPVKVASKDTLYQRGIKNNRMSMPPADLIIGDEVHLSLSPSWRAIFDYYAQSTLIGFTATPAGPKGRGLGEIYEDIVFAWPMQKLIDHGYLVPARYFAPTDPDLSGIAIDHKTGDYAIEGAGGIAALMDDTAIIGDVYQNWRRIAGNKQTVVFGCTRAHGQHLCHEFLRHGVKAEYVDGETPTELRKAIFGRIKSGETQVLCNCLVLTYGVDIPSLECAVIARPTKDIRMYLQICGRVLRISPDTGKTEAIIIDHAGVIKEHGYVTDPVPWSLDGKESVYERKERMQRQRKEKGEKIPKDIQCCKCSAIFRGRHDCPSCGFVAIPRGEPIPVIEAQLQEVRREVSGQPNHAARAIFYGQLKQYARDHGYQPGWAVHKYRERYGVLPWDENVKDAPLCPVTQNVANWIKHQQIRWAKSRRAA